MTSTLHKNLTGTDLHEPKGVAVATAGQVYRATGSGSGAWMVIVPVGAIWDIIDTSAPTGFHLCDGKTIGDATSGGTARANADQATLFSKLWATFTNTNCPIQDSAGTASTRGISAVADFAAHKRLPLPDLRERVTAGWDNLGTASRLTGGTGSVNGDTAGNTGGEESHALTSGENATHSHTQQGTITSGAGTAHTHGATGLSVASHSHGVGTLAGTVTAATEGTAVNPTGGSGKAYANNSSQNVTITGSTAGATAALTGTLDSESAHTHPVVLTGATANSGSGTAHNNVQHTFICPKMIFYGA